MTVAEFFGCTFLVFGPVLSMFILTLANDPIRIIIFIAAAFFWLLSLLVASLIWFLLSPLFDALIVGVVVSVFCQEAVRYLVFEILRRTESSLLEFTDNNSIIENKHILAYVSGLGFGTSSGIFILTNVLADMVIFEILELKPYNATFQVGPATYGLNIDQDTNFHKSNFFLISSALTLAIVLLNTFWNIILFDGCKHANYKKVGYVVATHLFVSLISLLNQQGLHFITLSSVYLTTIVTGVIAYKTVGGSLQNFTKFITCK